MKIERRAAKRSHGTVILADRPAWPFAVHDPSFVYVNVCGNYGVPDNATTHDYTIILSQNEILEALGEILGESGHSDLLVKSVNCLLRELLNTQEGSKPSDDGCLFTNSVQLTAPST